MYVGDTMDCGDCKRCLAAARASARYVGRLAVAVLGYLT
jgi:hypothetical protein